MIDRIFILACCLFLALIGWDASTQPVRGHLDALGDAVEQESRVERGLQWAAGAIVEGLEQTE